MINSLLNLFGLKKKSPNVVSLNVGIDKLIETLDIFKPKNSSYLVTIFKDNIAILQVVHGCMIKVINEYSMNFNYSISLNFDKDSVQLHKFKSLNLSSEFTYYETNEVPSFIINLETDNSKLRDYLIDIIENVYNYDRSDLFEFQIFEQAPADKVIPV